MHLTSLILAALLLQSASLNGTVTKSGTTDAVAKATLELRTADSSDAVQYTVTAGTDGKFSFGNVKPGKYRLAASRPGYVRVEYGQRKQSGRGAPIDVTAGQNAGDLKISLTPTGAISGRIYDTNGRPVVKATVQAMNVAYQNGRKTLSTMQSTVTDDLGEYRLFWLTPGPYYVAAVIPEWNRMGEILMVNNSPTSAPGSSVGGARFGIYAVDPLAPSRLPPATSAARYQTVYFPNTMDDQAAEAIDVKAAASVSGIDILLSPVRTRRVRGIVVDGETGQPPKLQSTQPVQIITTPSTIGTANPFADRTTGEFDTQILQSPTVLTGTIGLKMGRVSIPFGDTDIDGVRIVLANGYSLAGQVNIEGTQPGATEARLTSLRVSLRPDPQVFFVAPPPDSGLPSNTGAFTVKEVGAGDYRVNVAPILNGGAGVPPAALQKWYVKSIRYGDTDVLDELLHLEGRPNQTLRITVGTTPGSMTGIAVNEKQEAVSDVTVVLVPANRSRIEFFPSTTTDASGKFSLDRIPPGNYKAFAWEDVLNGAWSGPQFMKSYEDRGTPIRINDGGKQEVRLPVIPAK